MASFLPISERGEKRFMQSLKGRGPGATMEDINLKAGPLSGDESKRREL
jgi:hypothetical protein